MRIRHTIGKLEELEQAKSEIFRKAIRELLHQHEDTLFGLAGGVPLLQFKP